MDKLAHMIVFGVLAILCYISLVNTRRRNFLSDKPIHWTFLICSLYGIADELHQNFVKNRYAELGDWIADVLGILLALTLIRYVLKPRYKIFVPAGN